MQRLSRSSSSSANRVPPWQLKTFVTLSRDPRTAEFCKKRHGCGRLSCGMVAGLIHDIPTCKELIDRIMQGARRSSAAVSKACWRRETGQTERKGRDIMPDLINHRRRRGDADLQSAGTDERAVDAHYGACSTGCRGWPAIPASSRADRRRPGLCAGGDVKSMAEGGEERRRRRTRRLIANEVSRCTSCRRRLR
jgi:hypothetical protein